MNIITRASVKERIHVEQIIRSQPRMHNSGLVDIVTIPVRKYLGLSMDVYKPVGEVKEPLPIILDVHGGGLIAGRKEQNRNLGIQLARRGYIVFIPDYRQADSNWVTAEMREKFLAYIEKTYTPSAEVMKNKKFQSLTYDSAVKQYVYDRSNDTTSLDVMLKLLEKFDDSVIIDYLANPTGWEERFAKVLEQSGIWDSFAKEFAEPFVAYLVQTRQYLDAFSADPSCWESICKNLMAAVKDRKNVRLNIVAGGKSMQVVYPAVGIESYDTIRTKSLATYAISPARHQEEVERFLNDNYPNYSSKFYCDIPFDSIVSVSSGRKVLWENPLFGK